MQNLLFKGYLILAYLSFFEVSFRPFFGLKLLSPKKNITILVRHLEREAKITGKEICR